MVIGGRRTKFRGLVVRVKEGEGVAVRFEELSPEDIRDLRRELKLA
jgi:autonomous glycyl radical cofactor GrcA